MSSTKNDKNKEMEYKIFLIKQAQAEKKLIKIELANKKEHLIELFSKFVTPEI